MRRETERQKNVRMAVKIYDRLYKQRSNGRPFTSPAMIVEMINYGRGKWIDPFKKVCKFIEELRDEAGGVDRLNQPLSDYFTTLLNYYQRFKRYPTLKQITGPTVESEFINFIHMREDEDGAYWTSRMEHDRKVFCEKYGWGRRTYDPLMPHAWDGPGDPTQVEVLNKTNIPKKLGFRELVEYSLINPPPEDLAEYNRLFVEDEESNRWIGDGNSNPVVKPTPKKKVERKIVAKVMPKVKPKVLPKKPRPKVMPKVKPQPRVERKRSMD
jgi:hypothetical protein